MKAIPSSVVIKYWSIGSVLKRNQGMPVTAAQMKAFESVSSEVRIFAGGATYVDTDKANVPPRSLLTGPAIIVKSRGNIGFEFWTGTFSHKNELWSYSPKHADVNIKYVYYYLESLTQQLHELARSKSVKMPQLAVGDIDSLVVPFPDLAVQDEIVRVLDTFRNLELELEAELEARSKQLTYYLTSHFKLEGASSAPLSKVLLENIGGGTPSKSVNEYWTGSIPWASVGDLVDDQSHITNTRNHITTAAIANSSTKLVPAGHLIVAVKISPGKMRIAGVDLAINQDLRGLKFISGLLPKFVYYYFKTLNIVGNGTIVQGITKNYLEAIEIPIPKLEVQSEIVRVLDSLSDLQKELRFELRARQKQFRYYRDQLLSFKEASK